MPVCDSLGAIPLGNAPPPPASPSADAVIGMTSAYVILFVVGFLGNTAGLYIVSKKSTSRSVTNVLIGNLCVADLLVTVLAVPLNVVAIYVGDLWFGGVVGHVSCAVILYCFHITIAASILTILTVSVDRFYAIFYPLRGRLFRKPSVMSAVIWATSLVITAPWLLIYRTIELPDGNSYCQQIWYWEDDLAAFAKTYYVAKIYSTLTFAVLYAIPLIIVSALYVAIGVRLWTRRIPGNVTDRTREAQERSKRKVIKLLSVIVVVFALFWLPAHIGHYFLYFEPEKFQTLSHGVLFILYWIPYSQSAINPCLYILLNGSFRKEFVKSFRVFSFLERYSSRSSSSRRDSGASSLSTSFVRSVRSMVSLGRSTEYDFPRSERSVSCSSVVSRASLKKVTPKDTCL